MGGFSFCAAAGLKIIKVVEERVHWRQAFIFSIFVSVYFYFETDFKSLINGHKLLDKVEVFSEQCLLVLGVAGAREHSVEFPRAKKPPIWRLCYLSFRSVTFVKCVVCQQWQMWRVIWPQERDWHIADISTTLLLNRESALSFLRRSCVSMLYHFFSIPTAGSGNVFSSFHWSLIFIHSGRTHGQVLYLMQLSSWLNKFGNYFLSSLRTCMRFTFAFEQYMTSAWRSIIDERS
jgi:hypothetical protein